MAGLDEAQAGIKIAGRNIINLRYADDTTLIRDTKGTFHAKMGSIKDINGMDLIEAEDIKKKWQEYTEELYKKRFTTHIITMV